MGASRSRIDRQARRDGRGASPCGCAPPRCEAVLTMPSPAGRCGRRASFAERHAEWIGERLHRPCRIRIELQGGARAVIPLRGVDGAPSSRARGCGPAPGLSGPRPGDGRPRESSGSCVVAGTPEQQHAAGPRVSCTREARRDIEAAVRPPCRRPWGVRCGGLTLRDTRSRWGSCSARGDLNFSWRLVMAPPFVLDYLAAHEVAHLVHLDHSPAYWGGGGAPRARPRPCRGVAQGARRVAAPLRAAWKYPCGQRRRKLR